MMLVGPLVMMAMVMRAIYSDVTWGREGGRDWVSEQASEYTAYMDYMDLSVRCPTKAI